MTFLSVKAILAQMQTRALPDLNYLRECFELDPTSPSYLKWNPNRPRCHFKNLQAFESWKTQFANKHISNLTSDKNYYYLHIQLPDGTSYNLKSHRIVYALYYNTVDFDGKDIDHINRNGKDNSPQNLRLATRHQNQLNRSKQKNNKIGHKNIRYHHTCKKFTVQIGYKGKAIYFGSYSTLEEAIQVRDAKLKELAGEFFRTT